MTITNFFCLPPFQEILSRKQESVSWLHAQQCYDSLCPEELYFILIILVPNTDTLSNIVQVMWPLFIVHCSWAIHILDTTLLTCIYFILLFHPYKLLKWAQIQGKCFILKQFFNFTQCVGQKWNLDGLSEFHFESTQI